MTFPTGKDSDGYDTELKFLATKTVGKTSRLHQLHLNVSWLRNDEREEGERRNRYKTILGYSTSIAADWIFVADVVREALEEDGDYANLIEAGVRYQYSPLTVLAIGAGVGIGEESPDGRITGGVSAFLLRGTEEYGKSLTRISEPDVHSEWHENLA